MSAARLYLINLVHLASNKLRPLFRSRTLWVTRTIRGQILLAFLAMTVITGALGAYASYNIRYGGELVAETYDRSLMAINYARAASADFALMQVIASNESSKLHSSSAPNQTRMEELSRSLSEDLTIAAERSQSPRAANAARRAQAAVDEWSRAVSGSSDRSGPDLPDHFVKEANREIDTLINYTAGDGFAYRERARAAVAESWWFNLSALAAGLLLSALIARLLARYILRGVAIASDVANRIAQGHLDGPVPEGGRNELGGLLKSIAVMREKLRAMMEHEVMQRQSAQGRLFDAMDSSHEGIVVVDRAGRVVLANNQALSFLDWSLANVGERSGAIAGISWDVLSSNLSRPDSKGRIQILDGRWLNISRSDTREGGFVAVLSEMTTLKEQESRLEATNLRLDTALGNMSQGLCLFDEKGRLTVVNARYSEIFRLAPETVLLGLTIYELTALSVDRGNHPGKTAEQLVELKMDLVRLRKPASYTIQFTDNRIISVSLRPAPDNGWAATYDDVTMQRLAEKQVAFLARHDALTKLPNRLLFADRMKQATQRLGLGGGFAVLCLDFDRFKEVNDTLGHAMGDLLLQIAADRLRACVRGIDTIARLGGDEFAILQLEPHSLADTIALAERITEVVNQPYDLDGRRASIGVSIGIALAPTDGQNVDVLLRNADMALYQAKADGRDRIRLFEPNMGVSLAARRALGSDLRDAISNGEFELVYQPIYDLDFERVSSVEALLRWKHPVRGSVPPSDFISIAEELGLILPLGTWVLHTACLEAMNWPSHVILAVNISPAQLKTDQLVDVVTEALKTTGLPAARLSLEITETVLLSQSVTTIMTMRALRDLGVRFSLDDFGTGYASLSYLVSFPIDQIKIDQSFVKNLNEPDSGAIVRAIIGLARSLRMRVVAEGVEKVEQLRWLRQEHCTAVQGFLLSEPLTPSNLRELIALIPPPGISVGPRLVAGLPD
jgi:diguanylate cyclase (GGDEF)-like protein